MVYILSDSPAVPASAGAADIFRGFSYVSPSVIVWIRRLNGQFNLRQFSLQTAINEAHQANPTVCNTIEM